MPLDEIKRFMFISSSLNLINLNQSESLLKSVETSITKLISEGKGTDLLNELANYSKLYSSQFKPNDSISIHSNIDCITFILAVCSIYKKDEKFSHKGKSYSVV